MAKMNNSWSIIYLFINLYIYFVSHSDMWGSFKKCYCCPWICSFAVVTSYIHFLITVIPHLSSVCIVSHILSPCPCLWHAALFLVFQLLFPICFVSEGLHVTSYCMWIHDRRTYLISLREKQICAPHNWLMANKYPYLLETIQTMEFYLLQTILGSYFCWCWGGSNKWPWQLCSAHEPICSVSDWDMLLEHLKGCDYKYNLVL